MSTVLLKQPSAEMILQKQSSEVLNAAIIQKRLSEEFAKMDFQRASRRSEEERLAKLAANGPLKRNESSSGVGQPQQEEHGGPIDRTSDLLAAWGAGRFDGSDESAFDEFFTPDVHIDASAAAHSGISEFKSYTGIEAAKVWFAFASSFEFEGMVMSHVAGPSPGEVWLRFEADKQVSKKTGKGAAYSAMTVLSWEAVPDAAGQTRVPVASGSDGGGGVKCAKIVCLPFLPARTAAILSEEDEPIPPMAALPTFVPHPKPMEAYAVAMAAWGSGDLSKPEVFEKYVAKDALNDVADSALPGVLKAYEGSDAVREWLDHVSTNWEMTNMDVAPVAGLKPGCVTHRMTCDVKHKMTGKEAKGIQVYTEFAYNDAGQFVYSRQYWTNAPALASIYVRET